MSRRLRYQVAVSLDGFIAGPNGEIDWIVMDPAIDFPALFQQFDTAVMGRKTYEFVSTVGGAEMPGIDVVVFSASVASANSNGVRIVNHSADSVVRELKSKPGRDIWLLGGGTLFRSLLDANLVDTVELAIMPVLLGSGIPLLPSGATAKLTLSDQMVLPSSGIMAAAYSVLGGSGPPARMDYIRRTRSDTCR